MGGRRPAGGRGADVKRPDSAQGALGGRALPVTWKPLARGRRVGHARPHEPTRRESQPRQKGTARRSLRPLLLAAQRPSHCFEARWQNTGTHESSNCSVPGGPVAPCSCERPLRPADAPPSCR